MRPAQRGALHAVIHLAVQQPDSWKNTITTRYLEMVKVEGVFLILTMLLLWSLSLEGRARLD